MFCQSLRNFLFVLMVLRIPRGKSMNLLVGIVTEFDCNASWNLTVIFFTAKSRDSREFIVGFGFFDCLV